MDAGAWIALGAVLFSGLMWLIRVWVKSEVNDGIQKLKDQQYQELREENRELREQVNRTK